MINTARCGERVPIPSRMRGRLSAGRLSGRLCYCLAALFAGSVLHLSTLSTLKSTSGSGKHYRYAVSVASLTARPVLSADPDGRAHSAWAQTHNAAYLPPSRRSASALLSRVTNCTEDRHKFCASASRFAASRCDAVTGGCANLGPKDVVFAPSRRHGERSVEDPRISFEPDGRGGGTYWLVYSGKSLMASDCV